MRRRVALLVPLLLLASLADIARPGDDADREAAGFLPKDALGVTAFRRAHPEADGRGVLVAVLDTGLDLLHPALRKTPDGGVKIVDFYDATDAGLVTTDRDATVKNGRVLGLSGRRLRLGDAVPETIRLGLVRATEIYPGGLLRRLRKERREDRDRLKRLADNRTPEGAPANLPPDPGDPVHDVVLYRLDDGWRVLVDTDEDGDLAEETPLREYAVSQDVGVLGGRVRLGFGVDVRRDGGAVWLLFDGGGHGTHVAGIIAGYHGPDSPLDGLAPGARLLGVKIGNGRYGGATTHLSLIRGLEWAGRMGADVVNISFGGPSLLSDGREVSARFVNEAVEKYGYAVCLSAGNSGPALSTVGSPATARRAIAVGAWCPKSTQTSNYGVVDPHGGSLFGFSSRGPLPDGAPGIDFIAPGAAVSPVPEWSLVAGRNMNGTSMAAPQASGAIAVLLSQARHEELPVTPTRLVTALQRGARSTPGLTQVEQGYGLIDVGESLRALRDLAEKPEPADWVVEGGGHYDRAIVGDRPLSFEMKIVPRLGDDAERRTRFQRMIRLVPDRPWLSVASPVHVSGNGATVHLRADPKLMTEGVHVGVVRAIDIDSGAEVARLVVTGIRPRLVAECGTWLRETRALRAGETQSLFLRVPPGATQVRVEMGETAPEGGTRLAFRSLSRTSREASSFADPAAGRTAVHHRAVREGTTFEIVLDRPFQAAPGATRVEVGVCFRGVSFGVDRVILPRGRFGSHVNLRAGGSVRGRLEAKVDWTEEPLSLEWSTTTDPDAPALLGQEPVFLHEGTTPFHVPANRAEVRFDLGFESPMEDYLDDAVYRVEDGAGHVVAKGHFWRGPFEFKPPHRGRFVLRIHVWERGRHFLRSGGIFSPRLLRRIRTRKLAVRQDVYEGIVPGGPGGNRFTLVDASRRSALLVRPKGDETLLGTVRFVDDDWGVTLAEVPLRIATARPLDRERELRDELGVRLDRLLSEAFDRDEIPDDLRARIARLAGMARAAEAVSPIREARLALLGATRDGASAKAALPTLDALVERTKGAEKDACRRARAEVRFRAGDVDTALTDLPGDDEDVLWLKARAARGAGDAKKALEHLDRLKRKAPPPRVSRRRLRFDVLVDLGRLVEARRILREWTDAFPSRVADVEPMAVILEAAESKPTVPAGE